MKDRLMRLFAAALAVFLLSGLTAGTSGFPRVMAGEKTLTVNLDIGEEVYYGSYHTRFYTVDGQTAYCLEPQKLWPASGEYEARRLESGGLRKALYYLYGGPGYDDYVEEYGYIGFSGKQEKADEYCMSHCIAAYFYLGSDDAFIGLDSARARELKQKAEQIRAMPEPPEYFNAFIFETSENKQVMGGTGADLSGSVEIYKQSSRPEWTEGNPCYSLENAVFGLFEPGKDEPFRRIVTDENGYGRADDIRIGEYEIRELENPAGYTLDDEAVKISVRENETTVFKCADAPYYYPAGLVLRKTDADTGEAKAQGSASLSDAWFTVRFYPGHYDGDPAKTGVKAERTWVLRSDDEGRVFLSDEAKISGDPFYQNESGENILPLGTVTFEETKAPEGYLINEEIIVRKTEISGDKETDTVFRMPEVPEQVVKGHIQIVKFAQAEDPEQEQRQPLEGIRFSITSKTTGRTTVIETDENGYASTMQTEEGGLAYDTYVIREENAPEGFIPADSFEAAIDKDGETLYYILENRQILSPVKLVKKDASTGNVIPRAGARFALLDEEKKPLLLETHYPEHTMSHIFTTDESGSFVLPEKLPAGVYYFQELTPPEGYVLNESLLRFEISEDHDMADPLTVEFENEPAAEKLRVIKTDADSGRAMEGVRFDILAAEDIVTPDGTVRLKAGETAGTIVTGADGTGWSEELFPGKYNIVEKKTADGYMLPESPREVELLYREGKGVDVMIENYRTRITDTSAVWKKSGAKRAEAGSESVITDTVEMDYLNAGTEYILRGAVADGETGEPVIIDGKPVEAETRFTPRQPEMAVDMDFTVDSAELAGRRLVIYEYLYLGETLLSSHEDKEDMGQSVEILERAETAVRTGDELPDAEDTVFMAASSAAAGIAVVGIRAALRWRRRRVK